MVSDQDCWHLQKECAEWFLLILLKVCPHSWREGQVQPEIMAQTPMKTLLPSGLRVHTKRVAAETLECDAHLPGQAWTDFHLLPLLIVLASFLCDSLWSTDACQCNKTGVHAQKLFTVKANQTFVE